MYTRDDILTYLDEPFGLLSNEQRTAAEALAATDPGVADALRLSRGMGHLAEVQVFGEPRTSDAAFLVALRDRIGGAQTPARREAFGSAKLFGLAASVCAVLMVVIFGAGSRFTPSPVTQADPAVLNFAAALETETPALIDSLAELVTPESLAVYLDVPELAETWDFDLALEGPLSDELLALDPQSIEEVLYQLENTNFF